MSNAYLTAGSGPDRSFRALKASYRAAGVLPADGRVELVEAADLDDAEDITGDAVYAQHWHDGVRTDCLPPLSLLAPLATTLARR